MEKEIRVRSSRLTTIPESEIANPQALVRAVLEARGAEPSDYELKSLLHPSLLKGIDGAVELLYKALEQKQLILIVGDFDADGATSTAVAMRCLRAFGHSRVEFLVPNRFDYGYGLTPEIVALALNNKPDLIVTVDNGIASVEGVMAAQKAGVRVLVTDHHLPGEVLPSANAIVNPNQPGCEFPSKCLAGVGVIFYLMLALRTYLRERDWFKKNELPEPNLAMVLDLVALGTVADVVPLDQNNRTLVAQGLARIRSGHCCSGIKALLKIAGRDIDRIGEADFGFAIGPRLNAAGRLDEMSIGIQCLLAENEFEALEIAQTLDDLNKERRAIESSMQADALKDLEDLTDVDQHRAGICIFREDWHQGVVGIVASRIKDKYHRPTLAFAEASETELKGSGRSISGLHLRDVLAEVNTSLPGVMIKFGGHAMAAGVTINRDRYDDFVETFDKIVDRYLSEDMRQPIVFSDGELHATQFSIAHAQAIKMAGPWGQGFPEPAFHGEFNIVSQRIVGAKHLKLVLSPVDAAGEVFDAIAFNVDLQCWPAPQRQRLTAVFKLDINVFRGRQSLQLVIDYLVP